MGEEFWFLTFIPLMTGVLTAVSSALLGNFLILRRQSMLGDVLSHVMLPGIVIAFLISGTITTFPMLMGAAGAAFVAIALIEVFHKLGRVEAGTAMGVVFTALFALGVILLETTDTSNVHLDVEHALYGNLESLIWIDAKSAMSLFSISDLTSVPPEFLRMLVVFVCIILFLNIFWRPLEIISFDADYAKSIGIWVRTINIAFVSLCTICAVAAFDAVGAIIVIATFICPAAAARLLAQSLFTQVILSGVIALLCAIVGFVIAGWGPAIFGLSYSLSAAGMIATICGVFLMLVIFICGKNR